MKYSEFKTEVEKLWLGLNLGMYESYVDVFDKYGDTVSRVAKDVEMGIDTEYEEFVKLPQEQRAGLFDLLYEIAKTPLTEREEEKRYYLRKIPITLLGESSNRYFCKPLLPNYQPCVDGDRRQDSKFQTIFTESEIAEMDITGFEKVEVTE